ncbi:MAG: hypothetical protein PWQ96_302 [Clostridia bacterium]|jgi:Zn-dependent protease|nr:hypothetical protein [Clostridia bacterium]
MFLGSPMWFLAGIPAILIAIAFHEFAHGKTAAILGDPTPRYQGRLTLNPIKHLDPIGTLMLVLAGFGWAKPVQVNPLYFKGDRQKGMMLVALAGPTMNIVLAYFSAILINLFAPAPGSFIYLFLYISKYINVGLAVFNLIPLPPLDGSKILTGLLPKRYLYNYYKIEAYAPLILLLLLVTGFLNIILEPGRDILLFLINTLASFTTF